MARERDEAVVILGGARLASLFVLAILTSVGLAGAAHAQDPRIALGWMDQRVDEARATSPGVVWTEVQPAPFNEFRVEDAAEIDGRRFTASVIAYEGVIFSVHLSHEFNVTTAAQCYNASRKVIAALEPLLGALYWDVQPISAENLVRTPGGSTIMVSAWRRPHGAVSLRALSDRSVDGFAVRGRVATRYGEHAAAPIFMTDLSAPACEMQILVAPR